MVYKHAIVAAFRIYAQRGEVAAKRGGWSQLESVHKIVMEITFLIMGKSWKNHGNCAFEFLWDSYSHSYGLKR